MFSGPGPPHPKPVDAGALRWISRGSPGNVFSITIKSLTFIEHLGT